MVERQLPKLHTRVRFPSPAPALKQKSPYGFFDGFAGFVHPSASSFLIRALIATRRSKNSKEKSTPARQANYAPSAARVE
jgi:hypothetical protein